MAIGIEIFDFSFDEWLEKNNFGTFKEQSERFTAVKNYMTNFKFDYSMPNLDKFVYKVEEWLKESEETIGRATWRYMLKNSTIETITHLKKSIRIFEKVGVLEFQGDYISKFKQNASQIKIEIDSLKKLITNMEYIVHGEPEPILEPEPLPQNGTAIKLKWAGQKNQLYSVLRQLKEDNLILNTYNDLADFLIQNVTGFENTKKDTVEKELKRDKPLRPIKRIKIDMQSRLSYKKSNRM